MKLFESLPYKVYNAENGVYTFETERGLTYNVLVSDASHLIIEPFELSFKELSFEVVSDTKSEDKAYDERIEITIAGLIEYLLAENMFCIIYICSSYEYDAIIGQRLFKRWHNRGPKANIVLLTREYENDDSMYYIGLLYRKNSADESVLIRLLENPAIFNK